MVKLILAIVTISIVSIAVWFLTVPYWNKEEQQKKKDSLEREAIKDILKCGRRDIERLRESIEEDFKKVEKTTNEIKERLEKE